MYCSRANVWQEWGFTELRSGVAHRSSHSVQQLTQERQSSEERAVPEECSRARFVYSIRDPAFWTNWLCPCQRGKAREKAQEEEEREKTEPLPLMSRPSSAETTGLVLVWSCFFFPFFHPFPSLFHVLFSIVGFFSPSFPVEMGSKYWLKVEWKAFRSLFSGGGCPVSGHRGY